MTRYGYGSLSTGRKYRFSRLGGRQYACVRCGAYLQGADNTSGTHVCRDCADREARASKVTGKAA